jgi:hypothetical protein
LLTGKPDILADAFVVFLGECWTNRLPRNRLRLPPSHILEMPSVETPELNNAIDK